MESYQKLKSDRKLCTGERAGYGHVCNGTLYTCKQCGGSGCRQTKDNGCSSQAFSVVWQCLKCGAIGQQVLAS